MRQRLSICGLVEGKNSSEIGGGNKGSEEHINKRAFTTLGIMRFPRTNAKDKRGDNEILVLWHGTIVPSCIIEFSATLWIVTITNSGGGGARSKSFCMEDTPLVLKDMIS